MAATARYTAALRAAETARDDALFRDPFAETLAGPGGQKLVEEMEGPSSGTRSQGVPVRTVFFDRVAVEAASPQVVLLGAGFDTRGFRLGFARDVSVFEVDTEEMFELKEAALAAAHAGQPKCRRVTVAADLRGSWAAALCRAGFRADLATTWLAEGVVGYLNEDEVADLVGDVTDLSAPASRLAFDVVSTDYLTSPATEHGRSVMRGHGAELVFGSDDPAGLVDQLGWAPTVHLPGDSDINCGRLPATEELRAAGMPDVYFVDAIKT